MEREVWSEKMCVKEAAYAPKDYWGNRPPKGIVYNHGSPYHCRYGVTMPWPKLVEPYGFYNLTTWGIIVTTREDAEKRNLPPLNIDENGMFIKGQEWYERRKQA